jgi:hypothetical protein
MVPYPRLFLDVRIRICIQLNMSWFDRICTGIRNTAFLPAFICVIEIPYGFLFFSCFHKFDLSLLKIAI